MPEGLGVALATPGLPVLLAAIFSAGLIYGFAGFGAAIFFAPIATVFVPVETVALTMALAGIGSMFTVFVPAWRKADKIATATLLGASCLTLPFGTWILRTSATDALRWLVAILVAVTLAALVLGWRRTAPDTMAVRAGVGGAAGLIGGSTGLAGPVVILFNLSGGANAETMRANLLVFLSLSGFVLVPALFLRGLVTPQGLWLNALLIPLYMLGTRIGQAMFDPAREVLYRRVALFVIFCALLAGLPLWS